LIKCTKIHSFLNKGLLSVIVDFVFLIGVYVIVDCFRFDKSPLEFLFLCNGRFNSQFSILNYCKPFYIDYK